MCYLNFSDKNLVSNGETEKWVQVNRVKGLEMFKDYYWISNFGRVKSIRSNKKIMRQKDNGTGYLQVGLVTLDGKQKLVLVHRLVAWAFIDGYSEECNTVDHIFPDTKNNMASNLQWLSKGDNTRKEQSMPVIGECVKTGKIIRFESTQDAGRNGFYQGNVANACRGELSSHCKHGGTNIYKGYIWKYEKEDDANG